MSSREYPESPARCFDCDGTFANQTADQESQPGAARSWVRDDENVVRKYGYIAAGEIFADGSFSRAIPAGRKGRIVS